MSIPATDRQPARRNGPVRVGDPAPNFTLPNQQGTTITLADLIAQGPVVVYFYPKDESAGCTAEACSFRDSYEVFKEAGAEVVGISNDSASSHESFAKHHRLPFILLSDAGNKVRRLYKVPTTLGILPGRVTYIIDRQGIIRHIFNSQLAVTQHVTEALQALQGMGDAPQS